MSKQKKGNNKDAFKPKPRTKETDNKKNFKEPYKFITIGRNPDSKYDKCIICEKNECSVEDDSESYSCMLFNGEPICDICCLAEIDAGRGSEDIIDEILEWTGMTCQELYNKCMICPHSNKKGFYEMLVNDDFIYCYYASDIKSVVKNKKKHVAEHFCSLFEKKCPFDGNSTVCKHGAWYNDALKYLFESVKCELILRGYEFDDYEEDE